MNLPARIALTALLATVANGAFAGHPLAKNNETKATKQCQAGCAPKRSDATQFEQCMLDCRKPEVAQKFVAEKRRQQEQGGNK